VKKESARLSRGRPFRIVSRSIQLPVTKRRPHTHPRIAAANLCPMEGTIIRFKSREHIRNSGTRQAQLRVGEEEAEKKQAAQLEVKSRLRL